MTTKRLAMALVLLLFGLHGALAEDLPAKIERMERELEEMKRELQAQKAAQEKAQAEQKAKDEAAKAEASKPAYARLADRVQVGGYGSMRFEASDLENQKNSFVFRRFVLTTDANIAPRLRSYFELEFERFRKLELEKNTSAQPGGLNSEQAIEGTNDSEISLEHAWLQFDIDEWMKFRAGGVLVPLGRFNLNHDDNRWNLPRRSLVDRGVPVLPSTAAWDEVGAGFVGDVALSEQALLNYQ